MNKKHIYYEVKKIKDENYKSYETCFITTSKRKALKLINCEIELIKRNFKDGKCTEGLTGLLLVTYEESIIESKKSIGVMLTTHYKYYIL